MNHEYAINLMTNILDLQAAIPTATDYAAGVLLADLRKLLQEYSKSDFVIVRVAPDQHPFCVNVAAVAPWIDRLLADGTWQTAMERNQENMRRVMR